MFFVQCRFTFLVWKRNQSLDILLYHGRLDVFEARNLVLDETHVCLKRLCGPDMIHDHT